MQKTSIKPLKFFLRDNLREPRISCRNSLGRISRPDISCSIRELSRRVTSPYILHWWGLQHGPRTRCQHQLQGRHGYSGSDWGQGNGNRRSIAGCLLLYREITSREKIEIANVSYNVNISSSGDSDDTVYTPCDLIRGILGEMSLVEEGVPWCCENRGIM